MNETFTMDQMRAIVAYELSKEAPVLTTGHVVTQAGYGSGWGEGHGWKVLA